VQRGLAREGLRDWRGALSDYDRAVGLWGGSGDGVNPFALSYRGRARSEVGDLDGALADFRASAALFARVDKNDNQAAAARAQEAVTLYGLGRYNEAVRIARQVATPS
jgi:tetratricopeptide (TPR) repeat protein